MTRNRERLEVIHDILKAIQEKGGSSRPTNILYKSNLSHRLMEGHIKELLEKDFISESNDKGIRIYTLEQKGYSFLEQYKTITSFLELFGL